MQIHKSNNKIKDEGLYDISPILASAMNGKPIVPSEYEKRLAGATVLVHVTCDK
jgi:hypothetical protein